MRLLQFGLNPEGVRRLIRTHAACSGTTTELEAIGRLRAFNASADHVLILRRLANSAGLPWAELFPEIKEIQR